MERPVLVIGSGQAGLAAGYYLKKAAIPFVIVDENQRIGDTWRRRYDSLTLFTPRQFSALPGLPLPGNRELYPDRDEFADHLETYGTRFRLPVQLGRRVVRLSEAQANGFEALLNDRTKINASEVIIATGAFQLPLVPALALRFGGEVLQLTTETYSNPRQLPDGTVLVVGDGATGRDIAAEARKAQPTILATSGPRKLFPERLLGKSIWWWLDLAGVLAASADSWIGRKLKQMDAFPDRNRNIESLLRQGIRIAPRLADAIASEARFADGTTAKIRTVIWSIGYRDDTAWLDIPKAKATDGALLHRSGISPVTGLYYVGRPWQRNRASALVMGAGPDAEVIVQRLLDERSKPLLP